MSAIALSASTLLGNANTSSLFQSPVASVGGGLAAGGIGLEQPATRVTWSPQAQAILSNAQIALQLLHVAPLKTAVAVPQATAQSTGSALQAVSAVQTAQANASTGANDGISAEASDTSLNRFYGTLETWFTRQPAENSSLSSKDLSDLVTAITNRTLTIVDASQVLGLNYHQAYTTTSNQFGTSENVSISFTPTPALDVLGEREFIVSDESGGALISW